MAFTVIYAARLTRVDRTDRRDRSSEAIMKISMAPALVVADALDHAVILDRQLHKLIKLSPDGSVTGALAAIDIALWDLKWKASRQPIYKLLGGAWRTRIPFYASIGNNGAQDVDSVVKAVEARSGGCSRILATSGSRSLWSTTMPW
jgi:L-alanine-DL-glutamate epimerase-like enolase superfamily enzyme